MPADKNYKPLIITVKEEGTKPTNIKDEDVKKDIEEERVKAEAFPARCFREYHSDGHLHVPCSTTEDKSVCAPLNVDDGLVLLMQGQFERFVHPGLGRLEQQRLTPSNPFPPSPRLPLQPRLRDIRNLQKIEFLLLR